MIYELRHIYTAPGNDSNGHKPHTFNAGDQVVGAPYNPSGKRRPAIPMIKTENGYLIPAASVLDITPEDQREEVVAEAQAETAISANGENPAEQEPDTTDQSTNESQSESSETTIAADGENEPETAQQIADDYQQQLDEIKNTDIIQKAIVKSRNSVNGSLIGAGIGLGVGIIWRKNLALSIIVGAVFGGLIGNAWTTDFRKAKDKIVPKSS